MKKKTATRQKCETLDFCSYPLDKTSPHLRKQIRSFLVEGLTYLREKDADELEDSDFTLALKYKRRLEELNAWEKQNRDKNGVG